MDKEMTTSTTINQTYDFMNVDSFSQLPFFRPPPTTKDNSSSSTGIRLFGVDFSSSSSSSSASDSSQSTTTNHHETTTNVNGLDNRENNRKFECHYCYRNFPTSQALGGHQNAHKRERQNAKRAQFHSTVMAADGSHHHHHIYSLINHPTYPHYNNINTYSYTNRYSYTPTTTTTTTTNTTSNTFLLHRRHHGNHQYRPTLTGNPMTVWQIGQGGHGVQRNHSNNLPLLVGSSSPATIENFGRKFGGTVSKLSSSESHVGLEDKYFKQRSTIEQQVSLDLQL